MFTYRRYGKRFAVYAEVSKELGMRPFFRLNRCNGETVLNIPYGQVILTPGRKLSAESKSHDAEEQDTDVSPPAAGASEN